MIAGPELGSTASRSFACPRATLAWSPCTGWAHCCFCFGFFVFIFWFLTFIIVFGINIYHYNDKTFRFLFHDIFYIVNYTLFFTRLAQNLVLCTFCSFLAWDTLHNTTSTKLSLVGQSSLGIVYGYVWTFPIQSWYWTWTDTLCNSLTMTFLSGSWRDWGIKLTGSKSIIL